MKWHDMSVSQWKLNYQNILQNFDDYVTIMLWGYSGLKWNRHIDRFGLWVSCYHNSYPSSGLTFNIDTEIEPYNIHLHKVLIKLYERILLSRWRQMDSSIKL